MGPARTTAVPFVLCALFLAVAFPALGGEVAVHEPSPLDGPNSDPSVLRPMGEQAVLGKKEVKQVKDTELLAWAVACWTFTVPPGIYESAVLVVRWSDEGGHMRWTVAHVGRTTSPRVLPREGLGKWTLEERAGCETRRDYSVAPSDSDLAAFLRQSSFGYNDCFDMGDNDTDRMLLVVLYRDCPALKAVLEKGLPVEEKSRRQLLNAFP